MTINAYSARLDEILRQESRASSRDRNPMKEILPELALSIVAALLLSLICC